MVPSSHLYLSQVPDNLAYLGELSLSPTASIIKLPNISAPLNQLTECIAELRSKGYDIPMYPTDPQSAEDHAIIDRYAKLMGSAVNPVLREGNSDRRVAAAVKRYAQKNPHRMGLWSKASRTHVAHMDTGDFYGNEQAHSMEQAGKVQVTFTPQGGGEPVVMKEAFAVEEKELLDSSFLSVEALKDFFETEIDDAFKEEIMLSLHLKATMMKVSDPILFGHCIRVFFQDAYAKHGETLEKIGASPNQGIASIFEKVDKALPKNEADAIKKSFDDCYENRPWLAMVNSDKGITNLHAPNDVIIDASMPVVIRYVMNAFWGPIAA